jgi:apolipoprotein N-acyltransferase
MPLNKQKRYLLSALSGLLMVISFPFTGSLTPLVLISWIPLLLVEETIRTSRYRSGKVFIHAYLTFFIFNLGTTWWIWNASPGGAVMAFILNALLMAIAFHFYHLITKKWKSKYGLIILLSVWIGFEYLHHRWELSWPWLSFGNFFSIRTSWIQWYEYTGILGGSIWVLIVNYFGFKLFQSYVKTKELDRKSLSFFGVALLFPITLSLLIYSNYTTKKDPVEIVVVQPNIDPYKEKFSAPISQQLKKLIKQAKTKVTPETDLIIAPETALSSTFYEEELLQHDFYKYLKSELEQWKHASLYTGASTARFFDTRNSRASVKLPDGPGFIEFYNSSLLMSHGGAHEFLHKSKLVLGVEKIPFSDWLPFLEELSIENGGTSGTLGIEKEPKTLQTSELTFAPLICYESIYGDFCAEQCQKGAQVICVITNDGWWGNTPGYKQHMSFSRLRAIENRRSVARSANTGISCFIDQKGDVIQHTEWWKECAIQATLNKNSDVTVYSKTGDLVGKIFLAIGVSFILITLFKWMKVNLYSKSTP